MVTLAGCAKVGAVARLCSPLYGLIAVLLQWGGVAVARRRPRLSLSNT